MIFGSIANISIVYALNVNVADVIGMLLRNHTAIMMEVIITAEKEDLALEVLLDFLDAIEAGIAQAKQHLKDTKAPEKFNWNPDNIKWLEAEGSKGKFERSEDFNNTDFKTMLKDIADHKGKLTRSDYFYWSFQNGSTVGRKKRSF